jgi:HK97 family phage major capsid protein
MKISEALKQHMLATFKLAADISDEALSAEVQKRLTSGELSGQKFAELQAVPATAKEQVTHLIQSEVAKATAPLTDAVKSLVAALGAKSGEPAPVAPVAPAAVAPVAPVAAKEFDLEAVDARVNDAVAKALAELSPGSARSSVLPSRLYGKSSLPRVKSVAERYSNTKSALMVPALRKDGRRSTNPRAGMQALYQGRPLDSHSQLEKAVVGAFLKQQIAKYAGQVELPSGLRMTEEDQQLCAYAIHEMPWTGRLSKGNWVEERKLTDMETKALLDESGSSAGQELVPIAFDEMVLITPLLYGELYPMVEEKPISRGSRIESAQLGRPTMSSGTAEGTAISFQSTTAFASGIDTSIFPCVGAFELGLDFLEDSPVAVAEEITSAYGEAHLAWLDEQIAIGDGTTEPLGLFNTSGLVTLSCANSGLGGPITMGDTEQLLFALPKAVRSALGGRTGFVSTESTYRRVRAIPRGMADQARLFGTDLVSFQLHDRPYKIHDGVGAAKLGHFNFGYYRLYRRRGMQIRVETQGITLAKTNTMALVARSRWGGRLRYGSAGAVFTDLPTQG